MPDEDIVQLLQDLDKNPPVDEGLEEPYYREFYRRYSGVIYRIARNYGLNNEDSKDVLQEVFFRLYWNIHRFQPGRPFKPYFFKIAINTVKNRFRRLVSRSYRQIDALPDHIHKDREIFSESLHKMMDLETIINGKLTPAQKEVLLLKTHTDMNLESIAKTLGISRRLAYYRYNEAVATIKHEMGEGL